jgi:hypothetical protein
VLQDQPGPQDQKAILGMQDQPVQRDHEVTLDQQGHLGQPDHLALLGILDQRDHKDLQVHKALLASVAVHNRQFLRERHQPNGAALNFSLLTDSHQT